jgi:nitrite reductase (NADH) small subunit
MMIQMDESKSKHAQTSAPVRVCTLDELPVGLGRAFRVGERTIAIFRTRGGGVFAVDNRCPHRNGPLAEGMMAGNAIVCPLHAFRYDGVSGACDQPGACAVESFAVHVRENQVFVMLPPGGLMENRS